MNYESLKRKCARTFLIYGCLVMLLMIVAEPIVSAVSANKFDTSFGAQVYFTSLFSVLQSLRFYIFIAGMVLSLLVLKNKDTKAIKVIFLVVVACALLYELGTCLFNITDGAVKYLHMHQENALGKWIISFIYLAIYAVLVYIGGFVKIIRASFKETVGSRKKIINKDNTESVNSFLNDDDKKDTY